MVTADELASKYPLFAELPEERRQHLLDQLYLLAHTVVDECVKRHAKKKGTSARQLEGRMK